MAKNMDSNQMFQEMMQMMKELKEENKELRLQIEESKKKKQRKTKNNRKKIQKTYPIKDKRKWAAFLHRLPLKYELLAIVGVSTALRISDILPLRLGDIIRKEGYGIEEQIEKKTGKYTTVSFSVYEDRIKELIDLIGYKDFNDYLFPSTRPDREGNYTPITRQMAHKMFSKVAREVGVEHRIGTHFLRKTFAYWFLISNDGKGALAALQDRLGHEDEKTTLRYIGVTAESLQEMGDAGLGNLRDLKLK